MNLDACSIKKRSKRLLMRRKFAIVDPLTVKPYIIYFPNCAAAGQNNESPAMPWLSLHFVDGLLYLLEGIKLP